MASITKKLEDIRIVEKGWGFEEWIINQKDIPYCFKLMAVYKDGFSSFHKHLIKEETFVIKKGKIKLITENNELILKQGDRCHIEPNTFHKFEGLEDSIVYEISTHHEDGDVVRKTISGIRDYCEVCRKQEDFILIGMIDSENKQYWCENCKTTKTLISKKRYEEFGKFINKKNKN